MDAAWFFSTSSVRNGPRGLAPHPQFDSMQVCWELEADRGLESVLCGHELDLQSRHHSGTCLIAILNDKQDISKSLIPNVVLVGYEMITKVARVMM